MPVKRPVWYYFLTGKTKTLVSSRTFLKSVDGPIRELVRFLHAKGFKTTPSCSGHYRTGKEYIKVYDSLCADEEEIRNLGLKLKQIESGEVIIYKNKEYSLLYNKSEFVKSVQALQHNGLLGIRFGNCHRIKRKIMQLDIKGVIIEDRDGIVCIRTSEKNQRDNEQTWKKVTSEIKYLFQWIEYQ